MNPFERQIVGSLTTPGRRVEITRDYRSRNLGRLIAKGETGEIVRRAGGLAFDENARVFVRWDSRDDASWHDYGDLDDPASAAA